MCNKFCNLGYFIFLNYLGLFSLVFIYFFLTIFYCLYLYLSKLFLEREGKLLFVK